MFGNLESPLQNKMSQFFSKELWTRYMDSKSAAKLPDLVSSKDSDHGTKSTWRPVTSGGPQRSLWQPVQTHNIVNGLDDGTKCKIPKLADDTKWEKWLTDQKDLLPSRETLSLPAGEGLIGT